MAIFRITDVRARMNAGVLRINLKGPGVSQPLPATYPLARGAALLQIFTSGRDCYFDTNGSIVSTNPVTIGNPPGSAGSGVVVVWDMRMPPNDADPIDFFFGLANPGDVNKTSGVAAAAFVRVQYTQPEVKGVLAMLSSRYVFYENGALRNTDFTEGIL
ncbi:MAG TPA: hypothetical protein VHW00_12500 [Thermoanaerobaculia bacterium]|nr:hypothetical protein [Thermoanaerobaculia bacterium]